jgi:hypothetical protein
MAILSGLGGLNELLMNSILQLLIGHICRKFSPFISNFDTIGSLFTFCNSRIKSESP